MALVIFLKGVNVGGHRTFRPSILAGRLKVYGVVNIGTAGTFVARHAPSQARLRAEVVRRLPFAAEVVICRGQDLVDLASGDPFPRQPSGHDIVRFVSILGKRPRVLLSTPMSLPAEGRWILRILSAQDRFLFGLYRREMKAIRFLSEIDRLLGVPVTTRNWNTITAVLQALKS
jgi:uncharacterized protein (DUF1697 family)